MTTDFARINPANWANLESYTHTQLNTSDAYWPSVLRRDGVGNVTGTIAWAHGSRSWFKGGRLTLDTDGTFGSTMDVPNGTISLSGSSSITVAGSASIGFAAGLWPSFTGGTRTRSVVIPFLAMGTATGSVASSQNGIITVATGITYSFAFQPPHNGATISTIEVLWCPNTAHVGLPNTKPSVQVLRRVIGAGQANGTGVDLNSTTAVQVYVPVSLADYNNGLQKSATYTCDQNNVVDTSQYSYVVVFTDESGTNALATAALQGLKINYTAIADMRFP